MAALVLGHPGDPAVAVRQPAPVGISRQENPDRHAKRAREMRDARIDGDDEVDGEVDGNDNEDVNVHDDDDVVDDDSDAGDSWMVTLTNGDC